MDPSLIIFLVAVLIILVFVDSTLRIKNTKNNQTETTKIKKSNYHYYAKSHIMTQRESEFFKQLNEMLGSKWYIVPQVHLSALLNHKVKGQNWNAAFKHINGKSVDYVLLSKETMKPVCAIELDDSSHYRDDRIERDMEVERIFASAKIPLARLRKPEELSRQEIVNIIAEAIKRVK